MLQLTEIWHLFHYLCFKKVETELAVVADSAVSVLSCSTFHDYALFGAQPSKQGIRTHVLICHRNFGWQILWTSCCLAEVCFIQTYINIYFGGKSCVSLQHSIPTYYKQNFILISMGLFLTALWLPETSHSLWMCKPSRFFKIQVLHISWSIWALTFLLLNST